jgi:hypothetical protein
MDKVEQATKQYCVEELMKQMSIITPDYLQKTRLMLMVAYNLNQVDIMCDLNKFEIIVEIKFKFLRPFFKSRKKILTQIATLMQSNFIQYDIKVRQI